MTMKPYYSLAKNGQFHSDDPVLLFGGASVPATLAAQLQPHARHVLAADGGADRALDLGLYPELVWGDMDSISASARQKLGPARLITLHDQDSTDFEKALRHIQAPLIYGLGFTGERRDHELAACHALATHPMQRVLLISKQDVVCLAPPQLRLETEIGERVSLFPFGTVSGQSQGLNWPIDQVRFSPLQRIGTSNHAQGREIRLRFDQPRMLLILPLAALQRLSQALQDAPRWRGGHTTPSE